MAGWSSRTRSTTHLFASASLVSRFDVAEACSLCLRQTQPVGPTLPQPKTSQRELSSRQHLFAPRRAERARTGFSHDRMPPVRRPRRRRRLLAATLACTAHGLTIPMLDKAESAARATLARWSLEDAKLRRHVQREMRVVDWSEEGTPREPEVEGVIAKLSSWAGRVLDEEEYRAARIVESKGAVVRPKSAPLDVRGPLGDLEAQLSSPLDPEAILAATLDTLSAVTDSIRSEVDKMISSENTRTKQSEALGARLRPLDAPPSLIGDLEGFVDAVYREERARVDSSTIRPQDLPGRVRGPLARAERWLTAFLESVSRYEKKRSEIIRRVAPRPMEAAPDSAAGRTERFVNGLARGPLMFRSLVSRVAELLDATVLPNEYDDDPGADAAFDAALKRGPRPRR